MSITPQTKSTFISFAGLQHPGSGKVLEVRPWQDRHLSKWISIYQLSICITGST